MVPEDATAHADAAIPATRSPTRRRLVALLAGLPAAATVTGVTAATAVVEIGRGTSGPDACIDLFATFEELLARHEAVLWRCERLEAFLLAELEPPRVRLPTPAGYRVHYAETNATIIRHVPPGRRRWRLQEILLRRQRVWTRCARACGLTHAQEQEAALDAAVRQAAMSLLATPAATLFGIRAKILVLLASQEPGGTFQDASPWGELRFILTDLARLADPA